ncbi:MAG: type IIL restriction-modification enzyme MmeI [Nocardioides sp.]
MDPKARDHEISVTLARILFLMFGDDTEMWRENLFQDFILEHTAHRRNRHRCPTHQPLHLPRHRIPKDRKAPPRG